MSNLGCLSRSDPSRSSKARQVFERALKQGYNTAPLQIHLGKVYYQLGLYDKAEECFNQVLSIYPKEGSVYFLLGIVLKNKMLYMEAKNAFLKAIKYGSNQKEEHLGLAEIYTRQGEWSKAIHEYKQILHIAPNNFVAHYFLGLIYELQGNESEAIQELTRPSLGDYVHIGVLQSMVTSILAINPASRQYLYEVGLNMGRYSNTQFRFLQANPRILEHTDSLSKFRDL